MDYLVSGRWFSAPGLHGPWTFATPGCRRVQEDLARAPALPRAGVRARYAAGGRGRTVAQVPQTARVKRSEVKPPEVATRASRSSRRSSKTTVERAENTDKASSGSATCTTCASRRLVHGQQPAGAVEGHRLGAGRDLPDPGELRRYTTSPTSRSRIYDDEWVQVRGGGRFTLGMMIAWGCAVWVIGLVLPSVLRGGTVAIRPTTSLLAEATASGSYYNPGTGAYGSGGRVPYGPYGSAGWARSYNRTNRHLCARCLCLRRKRIALCRADVQSAHRHFGSHARRLERVRELESDRRAARRQLGPGLALYQQRDGPDHARRKGQRRGRLCRPRRQRLPQIRRLLAEIRQRRLEQRPETDPGAGQPGAGQSGAGVCPSIGAPTKGSTAIPPLARAGTSARATSATTSAAVAPARAATARAEATAPTAAVVAVACAAAAVVAAAVAGDSYGTACRTYFVRGRDLSSRGHAPPHARGDRTIGRHFDREESARTQLDTQERAGRGPTRMSAIQSRRRRILSLRSMHRLAGSLRPQTGATARPTTT